MLGGLSPRSALLDVGIGVVALALSVVFGRHAALSQPGTRLLDALGYALVVVSCAELAEQTRETEADRRAYQERLRIARDLHDVIGHSFAAVNVQARVATTVLETDRAQARRALTAIESISREALKRDPPGPGGVARLRLPDAGRTARDNALREALGWRGRPLQLEFADGCHRAELGRSPALQGQMIQDVYQASPGPQSDPARTGSAAYDRRLT